MAFQKRSIAYMVAVVGAIALPTIFSLTYYEITHDPRFKPLGVTKETLRSFDGNDGETPGITALLDWNDDESGGFTTIELASIIYKSFEARGVEVQVVLRKNAKHTRITYVVGKSRIGPYPTSRAGDGITAAVDALHTTERQAELYPRAKGWWPF
ncbi:MAG: hypothetical protein ACRBCL_14275 [Maritimibacter sp.]